MAKPRVVPVADKPRRTWADIEKVCWDYLLRTPLSYAEMTKGDKDGKITFNYEGPPKAEAEDDGEPMGYFQITSQITLETG